MTVYHVIESLYIYMYIFMNPWRITLIKTASSFVRLLYQATSPWWLRVYWRGLVKLLIPKGLCKEQQFPLWIIFCTFLRDCIPPSLCPYVFFIDCLMKFLIDDKFSHYNWRNKLVLIDFMVCWIFLRGFLHMCYKCRGQFSLRTFIRNRGAVWFWKYIHAGDFSNWIFNHIKDLKEGSDIIFWFEKYIHAGDNV